MNPPDGHEGGAGTERRALIIDLDELCWAVTWRDRLGQSSHWLNIESGDERWLRAEAIAPLDAFRTKEDFVGQRDVHRLARALGQALQQRKPFRGFKDTLANHPAQREAWFAFEHRPMERIARPGCEDHGIRPPSAARRRPSSA